MTCPHCGAPVGYGTGRGEKRTYCGRRQCEIARKAKRLMETRPTFPACSVPGCERVARSGSAPWCEVHYTRMRRHGCMESQSRAGRIWTKASGYRAMTRPAHPLADARGEVYEHRLVLYESIGPGEHVCYWCGRVVSWSLSYRHGGGADALVCDHLDGDRANNDASNLVPSCNPCNTQRGVRVAA